MKLAFEYCFRGARSSALIFGFVKLYENLQGLTRRIARQWVVTSDSVLFEKSVPGAATVVWWKWGFLVILCSSMVFATI